MKSLGSYPAITERIKAASSTDLVNGPGLSSDEPIANTPYLGTLPYVGLSPTTPHHEAGNLTDPAVSVPIAAEQRSAATAAELPPLEPPGSLLWSYGFLVVP